MVLISVPRLALLLALVTTALATSSRFRGAIVQWRPVDPFSFDSGKMTRILVTHRIAWQRGTAFFDASTCTPAAATTIGGSSHFTCRAGCSGRPGSEQFQFTDFSVGDDWSIGQGTKEISFPAGVTKFEASYTGCGWVSLAQGGGSWEVRFRGDFSPRQDNGRINSSPTAAVPPVVHLRHGAMKTINIDVSDADGDVVRCRWAESAKSECACVCNGFQAAVLDTNNCSLTYKGGGNLGRYSVALQVEDFTSASSTVALSSVPVQFLVLVENITTPAGLTAPIFVGDTPRDGACIPISTGSTYHQQITAMSGGENATIADISTVSPPGLTKSVLTTGSNRGESYIIVTWTPTASEQAEGANIFCYTATDNFGLTSEQICVTLVVGVRPPQLMSVVLISFDNGKFGLSMQFDQQIARPSANCSLQIYQDNDDLVLDVDVSTSTDAVYSGMTLSITTSTPFSDSKMYYLLADQGVAIATAFCLLESAIITDSSEWKLGVCDIAIHVSSVDSMLNELSGTVELSVVTTFSIPAPKKFSALIRLKNGTAKFGEDFTTTTGEDSITVEFDEGRKVASESVKILIHDDLSDEYTECFTVESGLMEGPYCNSSSTVCIMDNRIVLYSFQQPEYSDYESTRQVTLTLNSSRPIPSDYVVDVDTIYGIGNAKAGLDFKGSHFIATFTANSTVATVDIPIIADFISENENESFTVQLSLQSREILSNLPYITHVRLGSLPQAEIHILEEIVLDFQDGDEEVNIKEGANLTLHVRASAASDQNYSFTVNITEFEDSRGSQCMKDIDCGPHPVILQAGSMNASVNISLVNDEDPECDETFTAQIVIGDAGFRVGQKNSTSIIVKDDEEIQEQFCFGEEITSGVTSFETLSVNITRNSPACNQASIKLTLSFDDNGTTINFNDSCTFEDFQLHKICTINVRGKNEGFENDTVPGVVSLEQNITSFCNQTEKEVVIYKFPTYCWQMSERKVTMGEGEMPVDFNVSINRSGSTYPSYITEQCANISINGSNASFNNDSCCFSEPNNTEITCNITISNLNTSDVGNQTVTLQLEPTDHNLVCNQSLLPVILEINGKPNPTTLVPVNVPSATPTQPSNSALIGVSVTLAVLLLSAVGACVPVIACMYFRSRHSRKQITERAPPSVEYHYIGQANAEVVRFLDATEDEWEISRGEIEVGDKLGQGNYGAVFRGQLTVTAMSPMIYAHKQEMDFEGKSHLSVAVKMLRYNSSVEEKQLFVDEINVMKKVSHGNNPHILKMLGCVTTTNPMMLILQFVPHGNLKNYLRAMKTADDAGDFGATEGDPAATGGKSAATGGDPAATGSNSFVTGGMPTATGGSPTATGGDPTATGGDPTATGGDPTATGGNLTATGGDPTATGGDPTATGGNPTATGGDPAATGGDPAPDVPQGSHSCSSLPTQAPDIAPLLKKFLSFGYQITSGMEFLMSKEVIHRDLACRNVLVGDNELLKICDFGLAKETLEYTSALKTRLPIRWMAPEAFLRGEFSEKSDVWAYGVCLWEIFSFGDLPYSGLGNTVILSRVMAGYRLDCPEGCPDRIYSIMKECWNDDKESRPTFLELKEEFDGLISYEERYNYLPLDLEITDEGPALAVVGEASTSALCMQQQVEVATEDPAA